MVNLFANNSHLEYHQNMPKLDPSKETLRKSGYKATPPRIAIMGMFAKNKHPLSAQGVVEHLRAERGRTAKIDQATVYRTLKSLKEKGILRTVDLRHNHAHYELATLGDHHHIICLRCGKIEDVPHHGVEAMERTIIQNSKHFAEIRQHALEFYGICKACARRGAGS
jgi:Fe2+ or Zn2+ uptake regulation protein